MRTRVNNVQIKTNVGSHVIFSMKADGINPYLTPPSSVV